MVPSPEDKLARGRLEGYPQLAVESLARHVDSEIAVQ